VADLRGSPSDPPSRGSCGGRGVGSGARRALGGRAGGGARARRTASSEEASDAPRREPLGVTSVVYDAGALVAADRNERRMWAEHRVRLELGLSIAVPAPVLAQVSRSA